MNSRIKNRFPTIALALVTCLFLVFAGTASCSSPGDTGLFDDDSNAGDASALDTNASTETNTSGFDTGTQTPAGQDTGTGSQTTGGQDTGTGSQTTGGQDTGTGKPSGDWSLTGYIDSNNDGVAEQTEVDFDLDTIAATGKKTVYIIVSRDG